jgi:hypothetical protein
MSYFLQDIRNQVAGFIKDEGSLLTVSDKDANVVFAIAQYNHDKPNQIPIDITGTGATDYALPATFIRGWSNVIRVEYPVTIPTPSVPVAPQYLDMENDAFVYEDPTKTAGQQMRLRFRLSVPTTGNTIRITIETPYTVTLTASTLNQDDFMAICYLAAYLDLTAMSNRLNQTLIQPTIAADTVDYGAKSQNYMYNAKEMWSKYKVLIGTEDKNTVASQGGSHHVHIKFPYGQDLLMHPARTR